MRENQRKIYRLYNIPDQRIKCTIYINEYGSDF